jgi:hypothetical protein
MNETSLSGYGKSSHSLSQVTGFKYVIEESIDNGETIEKIERQMIKIAPPDRPASPATAQPATVEYTPLEPSNEHKLALGLVQKQLLEKTVRKAPVPINLPTQAPQVLEAPKTEPKSKGILRPERSFKDPEGTKEKTTKIRFNEPKRSFYKRWIRPIGRGFLAVLAFFFCGGNNRHHLI